MGILNRSRLRRVSQPAREHTVVGQSVSSGDAAIDRCLPGSGWPLASLTEIYAERCGETDIALLIPTIQRVLRYSHRRIALIKPPRLTTAASPARLGMDASRFWVTATHDGKEAFDTASAAMASGAFGVVIVWQEDLAEYQLRHLNRAADDGHCLGFLSRSSPAPRSDLPCPRLQVSVSQDQDKEQGTVQLHLCAFGHFVSGMPAHPVRSGARAA